MGSAHRGTDHGTADRGAVEVRGLDGGVVFSGSEGTVLRASAYRVKGVLVDQLDDAFGIWVRDSGVEVSQPGPSELRLTRDLSEAGAHYTLENDGATAYAYRVPTLAFSEQLPDGGWGDLRTRNCRFQSKQLHPKERRSRFVVRAAVPGRRFPAARRELSAGQALRRRSGSPAAMHAHRPRFLGSAPHADRLTTDERPRVTTAVRYGSLPTRVVAELGGPPARTHG